MNSVLIVGAGAAGLAAAKRLAEAGVMATILQARNRIGGRIHTVHDLQMPLELGAEFVHGKPDEIWKIVREENLKVASFEADTWCFERGRLYPCKDFSSRWRKIAAALKQ